MSLGSFTSAKTSGDTFLDSFSNDIIIKTSNAEQRILLGFASNVNSVLRLGASNAWFGWSNAAFSNMGTFHVTSNADIEHMLYSSNVYIGTPNSFSHSNFQLYCTGNGRIAGDLYVDGSITSITTEVQITDQLEINNMGTGTSLIVNQDGAQAVAEFNQTGNRIMTIANNTYVAIGSQQPEAKLDVAGDSIQRGSITCSNVYASNIGITSLTTSNLFMGGNLIIDNTGIVTNSNFIPSLDATKIIGGDSATYSFSSNYIRDRNIVTAKMESNISLGGKVFVDGFVNVGYSASNYTTIAASTNAYRMQINHGDIVVCGSNNFAATAHQARINIGDCNYFIAASKDVGMLFQTANTPYQYPMFLEDTTGYLGLGTVDPTENLHVIGNAKFANDVYVLNNLSVNTSNAAEAFHVASGNARFDSNAYIMASLAVASSNPTETLEVAGANNAKLGSNLYVMSSIGVNTSNPLARFHVQDGAALIKETRNNVASTLTLQHTDIPGFTMQQEATGKVSIVNTHNTIDIFALSNVAFSTTNGGSNVERLRIKSTGQIGVGTVTPNVSSLIHVYDAENSSNAQLRLQNHQGYSLVLGQSPGQGSAYISTECNLNMAFVTNNYERARITSNGDLGIGTAAPSATCHIHSASNNFNVSFKLSDADNTLLIAKASTQDCSIFNASPSNALVFGTSNIERFRIDAEGNVGIAKAPLGDRLEVDGNIRAASGTVGPMMMLLPPISYTDVPIGSLLVLDNTLEAGNEVSSSTWRPLFYSPSFLYNNQSGESMEWTSARLVFRGMSLSTLDDEETTMIVKEFYYNRSPQYADLTPTFTFSNMNKEYGYVTCVTPWFTQTTTDVRHLAIQVVGSTYNSTYRFGSVYIQYRSFIG